MKIHKICKEEKKLHASRQEKALHASNQQEYDAWENFSLSDKLFSIVCAVIILGSIGLSIYTWM